MRHNFFFLLFALLLCSHNNHVYAQIDPPSLEADNIANISFGEDIDCETKYCRPGVRNRSQSRGVVIRYERQAGFDWSMANDRLEGAPVRVNGLEQFTFKFKVPILNKPGLKFLLGYEWDTEKYYFDNIDPIADGARPTMWQLLDERRLKATKISAYLTKSFNETFYISGRLRLSLQGDYDGLMDFAEEYRTYSGGVAFGKKVSQDEEWGVGLTYSQNPARTVILPFFIYNKTWNDYWGLESALPGQIFLRYNIDPVKQNAFKFGAAADSRFYVINSLGDKSRYTNFEEYYLRRLAVRGLAQYEHKLSKWFWAFVQGGVVVPINTRFNSIEDVDLDLNTEVGARPFLRIGLFLAPPKELVR
ncbi:hypothetical protein CEQ90_18085 [Lewinellaceae bacterium SD302]|nr:hypothetical protein CEQ90_18085 [Lewinellaceae bacterium SD302]